MESHYHLVLRSAEGASRRTLQRLTSVGRAGAPFDTAAAPPAQDEVELEEAVTPNRNCSKGGIGQWRRSCAPGAVQARAPVKLASPNMPSLTDPEMASPLTVPLNSRVIGIGEVMVERPAHLIAIDRAVVNGLRFRPVATRLRARQRAAGRPSPPKSFPACRSAYRTSGSRFHRSTCAAPPCFSAKWPRQPVPTRLRTVNARAAPSRRKSPPQAAQSLHRPTSSTICRCGAKPARLAASRNSRSSLTSSISALRPHFSHKRSAPWCAWPRCSHGA